MLKRDIVLTIYTYGDVTVRVKNTRGKHGKLVGTRYLQTTSLLMSENMSAPDAIKAVNIFDKKIWEWYSK